MDAHPAVQKSFSKWIRSISASEGNDFFSLKRHAASEMKELKQGFNEVFTDNKVPKNDTKIGLGNILLKQVVLAMTHCLSDNNIITDVGINLILN